MKIKEEWISQAKINKEQYLSMYENSIDNNEQFWKEQAERIHWEKKFTVVFSKIKIISGKRKITTRISLFSKYIKKDRGSIIISMALNNKYFITHLSKVSLLSLLAQM